MKYLVILFSLVSISTFCLAQPEDHPHHEKHYGEVDVIESDEIKLEVTRPHSQVNFTQFTAKIYNKTADYILVKKHKIGFTSSEMGYGTKYPKEDIDFIEPHGDITRTIKVEGGIGFKVNELEIGFEDVFSRAPVKGKRTSGGEFKMKPDKNSAMMEPFAVTLKKWRFSPKELSADFKIRYRGESIGIVNEGNVKIRKEDGTILENTQAKSKPFIIPPMSTRTVGVVRPFAKGAIAKGESVYVVWDEALEASESTPFKLAGFRLIHDAEKTKAENK